MRIGHRLCALILSIVPITAPGQQTDAPQPQRGTIRGAVTDVDDAAIPGATLTVDGPAGSEHRTLQSDETGTFEVKDLAPALAYKITVRAKGFADWT
jgi:Carboxypeptidase regulatory-like domain